MKLFSRFGIFGSIIMAFTLAIMVVFFNVNIASAQADATCNGVPISGTPEQIKLIMDACTVKDVPALAGATPVTAGQCRVNRGANLRSAGNNGDNIVGGAKIGDKLAVLGHSPNGDWTQTDRGFIWTAYCTLVPTTIETAAQQCKAYVRDDGFRMDVGVDVNGNEYDKTIVSTVPTLSDGSLNLCDPCRFVQDGAGSSVIHDRLDQPPAARTCPDVQDFTFLSDDWKPGQLVYYSGVAGCTMYDPDKSGPKGLEFVLDVDGVPVCGTENGIQFFDVTPYIGGWMAWDWDGEGPWGARYDHKPWTD